MIAAALINIARARLGDTKRQRWTDDRLLQILNEGQADICKTTGIYRKETVLPLAVGQTRYILPSDCMTIKRLEYKDNIVSIFSRNDLDVGKTADGEFVGIKDNLPMGNLDIYPALEELEADNVLVVEGSNFENEYIIDNVYGVVTDITTPLEVDPVYGVVSSLDNTPLDTDTPTIYGEVVRTPSDTPVDYEVTPSNYGVTTGIETVISDNTTLFGFITDSDTYEISGKFGITTDIVPAVNTLRVYYDAVPANLTDSGASLVIPDIWESSMVRYIVGTALQDDNDSNNIQRGEMELQKYGSEVLKARELSTKDFSSGSKNKYETRYRRI